jgi:hypothetical protein
MLLVDKNRGLGHLDGLADALVRCLELGIDADQIIESSTASL